MMTETRETRDVADYGDREKTTPAKGRTECIERAAKALARAEDGARFQVHRAAEINIARAYMALAKELKAN